MGNNLNKNNKGKIALRILGFILFAGGIASLIAGISTFIFPLIGVGGFLIAISVFIIVISFMSTFQKWGIKHTKSILEENFDELGDFLTKSVLFAKKTSQAIQEDIEKEESKSLNCKYCGSQIEEDSKFCSYCGREL